MKLRHLPRFAVAAGVLLFATGAVRAQHAVSARAGMINVAEGDVFLSDDRSPAPLPVDPRPSELISMKEGQTLRTGEGRAEILLTPGAFLRLGESSAVRLHSNRLSSVRLEIVGGSALIDVAELLRDNSVIVLLAGAETEIEKAGLYRFDAAPPRIRVFSGQATVTAQGRPQTLKSGRELRLEGGQWAAGRFDPERETDPLYRWSQRRSGYIAMANVSAARQAGSVPGASAFHGGTWLWNPWFGFATYVPWTDTVRSPFGYSYYTPYTVYDFYYPQRRAPRSRFSLPRGPAPGAASVGSRGRGAAGGSVGGAGGLRGGSGGRGN